MAKDEKAASGGEPCDALARRSANHVALSPISFLRRAAKAYPDRLATVYNGRRTTWAETDRRARRLASALSKHGVRTGDSVAIMAANTPELYEAHFGVPMSGAVLCALNIRLDADTIAYILAHSGAKVVLCDREFSPTMAAVLGKIAAEILVVDIIDPAVGGEPLGAIDYEALLAEGDPDFVASGPDDEWDAITLNYTSGTTGRPKGVVYHHRGAYLNAIGNIIDWNMGERPIYLWTLPMFHCNGWCFPWSVAAKAGTNICLRKVSADAIYAALVEHGVDHLCGAPIVLRIMLDATEQERRGFSRSCKIMTAGAPPPATVLLQMQAYGFDVTHAYGLTETYGPSVLCAWREEWDVLDPQEQASKRARQGLNYVVLEDVMVADPLSGDAVPKDGATMGEIFFRGNVVMKGYLNDDPATEKAFEGGWFRSGDLAVAHPDGYIQIKDRAKDIIISGGENISSIEIEDVIYRHPAVVGVAVVAMPDEKWGETPTAYVELASEAGPAIAEEIMAICRAGLASFKCPRQVIFTTLPRTSTGKIQKRLLRDLARASVRLPS
ncbi:AMP-binding protein [Acidisoma cellulosilytica]|uniref:3-methylmercaptopropionyl-CoA ligase n=1 Tax=Acidisoma cellulosilyticum TaxID=2802395 RepID=A0A963Z5T1_9PROT|nr:AMP-binding protein [Acidisoma cellulosilyticum]MCB8883369.1 AMP-binding protein [Acidisoma cellulosilyticum]